MVEWSITAVLKTAVLRGTGGSNPSLSAFLTYREPIRFPFFVPAYVGFQPSFSSHIIYFQRCSGEQSSELAMPKLIQASLWSFGLTKTLSSLSKLSFYIHHGCQGRGHPARDAVRHITLMGVHFFLCVAGGTPTSLGVRNIRDRNIYSQLV